MDTDKPPSSHSNLDDETANDIKIPLSSRIASWLFSTVTHRPESRNQLIQTIREAHASGVVNSDTLSMLEGALAVSDSRVRDIMIPRSQMVVIEREATPRDLLRTVVDSGHSRFPVVGDSRDEVAGILLAKDMLRYAVDQNTNIDLREVLRPAVFVPESKRLNVLLWEFRSRRNHMAVVVDEYGGIAGLVTIEDVLEQIVGDIDDEHDQESASNIVAHRQGRFSVHALTELSEFNAHFSTRFSADDMDTIGGFVTRAFGFVPKRGETTIIDGFQFKVLRSDGRRIRQLQVLKLGSGATGGDDQLVDENLEE
jgi:magnesium and cobalt transporter